MKILAFVVIVSTLIVFSEASCSNIWDSVGGIPFFYYTDGSKLIATCMHYHDIEDINLMLCFSVHS